MKPIAAEDATSLKEIEEMFERQGRVRVREEQIITVEFSKGKVKF